jgi:hypothetical protein
MRGRLPWILFFVSLALNVSVIVGVLWVGHGRLFGPPTGEQFVGHIAKELRLDQAHSDALLALRKEVIARRAEVEATAGRGVDTVIAALQQETYDPEAVRWASIERSQPMREFFIWLTGRLHDFVWTLEPAQREALIQRLNEEPRLIWMLLSDDSRRAAKGG